MKNNNVISQLVIKGDPNNNINDITYNIGPESKYIRALYRSNNKNFDEYYLLGTNTIANYYEEEREIDGILTIVSIEEIKFCREKDANNYYILKKEKQVKNQSDTQLIPDNNAYVLQFNDENDMQYISESQTIKQIDDDINFQIKNESINIIGDTYYEHQFLSFINESQETIPVLQKNIVSSTNQVNGVVKTLTTETISEPS